MYNVKEMKIIWMNVRILLLDRVIVTIISVLNYIVEQEDHE